MQHDEHAELSFRQVVFLLQDIHDAVLDIFTDLLDLEHGDDRRRLDLRHDLLMPLEFLPARYEFSFHDRASTSL